MQPRCDAGDLLVSGDRRVKKQLDAAIHQKDIEPRSPTGSPAAFVVGHAVAPTKRPACPP